MTPLPLLVLEAGSGTKFLTISTNPTLWTHFGSHKELGVASANLTPGLSFAHNLCFRCPNEPRKPNLDIYTSIAFQWYKYFLKARSLALAITLWRFESSFATPTPNMEVQLGVWGFIPSHSLHSWEHVECSRVSHLARNLATPCLGHEPKARVATHCNILQVLEVLIIIP
jgi:hypothetical protein